MALVQNITSDDLVFIGTDLTLRCRYKDGEAPPNVSGWALSWMLKRRKSDGDDEAIITKTSNAGGISVSGTYNADPDLNEQRIYVAIADEDTAAVGSPAGPINPGSYRHELKRTDEGLETVLLEGSFYWKQGVHR